MNNLDKWKLKVKQNEKEYELLTNSYSKEMLSTCCGWAPEGNIHLVGGAWLGLCSKCLEHVDFEESEYE